MADSLDNLKQAGDKAIQADKARQEAIKSLAEIINRNGIRIAQRLRYELGKPWMKWPPCPYYWQKKNEEGN